MQNFTKIVWTLVLLVAMAAIALAETQGRASGTMPGSVESAD